MPDLGTSCPGLYISRCVPSPLSARIVFCKCDIGFVSPSSLVLELETLLTRGSGKEYKGEESLVPDSYRFLGQVSQRLAADTAGRYSLTYTGTLLPAQGENQRKSGEGRLLPAFPQFLT